MKYFVAASALAAVASAAMQVHLYTDDKCTTDLAVQRNQLMAPSDCVTIQTPITASEMNEQFTYLRQSHIADEVLLFNDFKTCIEYPGSFDRNQQVAFIRADKDNECEPCYRCGNVKSVKMVQQPDVSSATSTVPAVLSALVLAGVSTLFL